MTRLTHRDLIPALALILIGGWALWETQEMSVLGAVFPRLAGAGMLLGGLLLAGRAIVLAPPARVPEGGLLRPVLFLALLLAWAVLLPVTGFVATSVVASILAMLLSAEDRPTPRSALIQAAALVAIVILLALVFGQVLKVKLP